MKAWPSLLLLVLPACASSRPADDDASGAGSHDPSTLSDFFAELCASEAPCCVDGGFSADPAECLRFFGSLQVTATYDAVKGADCVKWLRDSTRDYTVCLGEQSPPASCAEAIVSPAGAHLPGEACSTEADCAPSSEGDVECHLDIVQSTTTTKCQLQLSGHVGDTPCLGTRDGLTTSGTVFEGGAPARGYVCDLADGVYCDGTACAPVSPVGGPCDEARLCDTSSYCAASACVARKALTVPCDRDGECSTGLLCDRATGACAAPLATGAPCTDSAQCESSICLSGVCVTGGSDDDLGLSFICVPK